MNLAVLKLSFYLFPVSVLNVPYELSSIKAVFLSIPGICFECAI